MKLRLPTIIAAGVLFSFSLVCLFVLTPGHRPGLARREAPGVPVPLHASLGGIAPAARAAGADEAWWRTVSAGLQRQEYDATLGERGLQAPNRAQNLRTLFGPRGIEIEPRAMGEATPTWRFGWETAGLGRPGRMAEAGPAVLEHEASRVTYVRLGWSEWYENTEEGLEQGFTVSDRPDGEGLLRITGALRDKLRGEIEDGAVDFFDAHGAPVLRYAKLAAYDAEGRTLPSRLALEGTTIALEIDDRGAAYPITVDPLLSSPSWTAESNRASTYFGVSVATAGDVNGDGFSDVVVGAYGYDNGETNEGRAYLFLGSPGGLGGSPAWTAESNQAFSYFGYWVATAGDVNGDGYSDVVVAADSYDNGQVDEGRAYVYHGSAAGLGAAPAWIAESDLAEAYFGVSAATAGDVNGDGFSDVVVGAPGYDNGPTNKGRAFVYLGSPAGLAATPASSMDAGGAGATFGNSVATAGDVNGDGFDDVVVGDQYYGETDVGAFFVFHGSAGGLGETFAEAATGSQPGSLLGISVSTAGDVNGDGYSDVIAGAWYYSNGEISEGAVFLYSGAAGGVVGPVWTVEGNQTNAHYGFAVSTAGDVNGDGFSDVIVGAHGYDNGQANEGRAFLYKGSAFGLSGTPSWTAESDQADALFGISVATAGDVNGDGFSDIIVGAEVYDNGETDEGRAFVYHGAPDGVSYNPNSFTLGGQAIAGWGWSVATAGDVNGDGYSDIIAVARSYDNGEADEGKVWVYHGSPSGVSPSPAWSAETNQVAAEISSAACAGDVNGDGYSDVIVGSPYFDFGPSTNEGRAYVFMGSPSGLGATAAWTANSGQPSAWLGWSVGSAGDVNGDGYGDVIIGADGWDLGQSSEGRVWVFYGSAAGLGGNAWSVDGDQEGAGLGYSVGTAGDVNGDGFSDILIALPSYDNGDADEGVVWVFHGSAAGLGTIVPSRVLEANQAGASFGFDVATAGDVNGDGYSDVVVGAQAYDGGQTDEGRAYVYHGGPGGLAAAPAWTSEPDQASAQFGRSVASAGDVNGDGYSDVIVGAPFYDDGQIDEGHVWVYHGSPSGLGGPAGVSFGDQPGAFYGLSVGTAGDVNGDGFSDAIVGAFGYNFAFSDEGAAWVFLGNGGDGLHRPRRQLRTDALVPIDLLGLSNSQTGVRLEALARTAGGRDRVRLEAEVKPVGVPFDGTGIVKGSFGLTGAPAADGSTLSILHDIGGLASGTPYHWRLRIASDSPFFPRSPWLSLPYNGANETDVRTAGPNSVGIAASAPPAAGRWLGLAAPNPFTNSTRLAFTLPHREAVRLGVYDVQGRLVARLAEGARDAGEHQVMWDGRDHDGRPLAAGVYFVRLEHAGRVEAQKVVMMR